MLLTSINISQKGGKGRSIKRGEVKYLKLLPASLFTLLFLRTCEIPYVPLYLSITSVKEFNVVNDLIN